jgi:hypothetical protein
MDDKNTNDSPQDILKEIPKEESNSRSKLRNSSKSRKLGLLNRVLLVN